MPKFNWSPDFIRIRGRLFKPYNIFNSQANNNWGVGLIQIGRRHAFAVIRTNDQPNLKIWLAFKKVR